MTHRAQCLLSLNFLVLEADAEASQDFAKCLPSIGVQILIAYEARRQTRVVEPAANVSAPAIGSLTNLVIARAEKTARFVHMFYRSIYRDALMEREGNRDIARIPHDV